MTASAWSPEAAVVPQVNVAGTIKTELIVATDSQRVFSLKTFAYAVGTGSLLVFSANGILSRNDGFVEVDGTTFMLSTPAAAGDKIVAIGFVGVVGTAIADTQLRSDMLAQGGANLMSYALDALYSPRSVLDKLQEQVSLFDFIPKAQQAAIIANTSNYDASADINRAIAWAAAKPNGAKILAPRGKYHCLNAITMLNKVTLQGEGKLATTFEFANDTDGFVTTNTINSSTGAFTSLRDLGVVALVVGSTHGGVVDVGGTYVEVRNVYSQGWKHCIIFDQTELATIEGCYLQGWTQSGVWLVNGPDHTPGANKGFTNRIKIADCQFNNGIVGHCIRDDGGANHLIIGNNFNQGSIQIFAAGVAALSILNNEFEGCGSYPIFMSETTNAGVYVGPCCGFHIQGNGLGGGIISIFMQAAQGGDITGNIVYQYSTCAFEADFGPNWRVVGVNISGNYKSLINGNGRTDLPFFSSEQHKAQFESQSNGIQNAQTWVANAAAIGYQQITPKSMEGIYNGTQLRVLNSDGTNAETVTVFINPASPTTFFATFASTKTAGWLIHALEGKNQGNWTPVPAGSNGQVVPTTKAYGSWTRRGNRFFCQVNCTWTGAGTATGQLSVSLPVAPKYDATAEVVVPVTILGPGAVGKVGQVYMFLSNSGVASASFVYVDNTTGAYGAFQVPASGELHAQFSFEV